MKAAISITKKNFKKIFNSKLSFLILFFGPLFLMVIVGGALQNNSLKNVRVSLFSHSYENLEFYEDEFTRGFENELETKSFIINKPSSLEDCKQRVLNSIDHACIELIKGVKKNPLEENSNSEISYNSYEVKAHVDFSQSRIVWGVISSIKEAVDSYAKKIIGVALYDVKSELDNLVNSLERENIKLNKLTGELYTLETSLTEFETRFNDEITKINTLKTNFANFKNNLGFLLAGLSNIQEVDQQLVSEVSRELGNLDSSINSINIEDAYFIERTKNLKETVKSLRLSLVRVSNQISTLTGKWKALNSKDLSGISNPFIYTYQPISGDSSDSNPNWSLEFLDYLFPSFLMFFIIFISTVFSTLTIVKERTSKAHIRNMTSNFNGFKFIIGNFVSIVLIIILQTILIISASIVFLNLNLFEHWGLLLFIIFLTISLLSILGMAIGYIFSSQEGALIASISFSLLLLIFMPVITPLDTLPDFVSKTIKATPFVILEGKLRTTAIFSVSPSFRLIEISSILISLILSISLLYLFYKISREKEI